MVRLRDDEARRNAHNDLEFSSASCGERDKLQSRRARSVEMTVADIRGAKRPAKKASTASKQDLRAWLEALGAAGEVQEISGAEGEAEIGGIVDLYMCKMGKPGVLFD